MGDARRTKADIEPRRPPTAAMAAAIVLAVGSSFLPVVANDFVDWDDDLNLTSNPAYRGLTPAHLRWMFTTTHGGHYQPLSWLTLALDHALWGMDPTGYHLTNLALHAVNAVLLYVLIVALLRWTGAGPARASNAAAAV